MTNRRFLLWYLFFISVTLALLAVLLIVRVVEL